MRGDCGLPQFNPKKPHELRHFFEDLKFHFARSQVVDEEGEASRVGISLLTDLGKYHREFIAMTTFLITKNRISTAEQS